MNVGSTEFEGRRVQVQICAPTYALPHICTGYIYCPQGRRLLDHLNDVTGLRIRLTCPIVKVLLPI